jgi:hypothetical protein
MRLRKPCNDTHKTMVFIHIAKILLTNISDFSYVEIAHYGKVMSFLTFFDKDIDHFRSKIHEVLKITLTAKSTCNCVISGTEINWRTKVFVLETFVYSPLNHLTRLLAREDFVNSVAVKALDYIQLQ